MRRVGFEPWGIASLAIAGLVMVPLSVIFSSLLFPSDTVWSHLVSTILVELLRNTLWLALGVAAGTGLLGVSLAWLTAACEFPGRRFFDWALMLPLAIPAYVTGFVMIGLLDFAGPLQSRLRGWLGPEHVWFPKIRSLGGVILVMTLALYPYVYLLARNAFLTQGTRFIEIAQSLGHGRWRAFFRVALPMARPWIAGGLALALMETLADFGTVATFNYDTFTTAIYKSWFGLFSLPAASQLASLLVLLIFAVLAIEQRFRIRSRYTRFPWKGAPEGRSPLRGAQKWFAAVYALLVLLVAFAVPVIQLSIWTAEVFPRDFDLRYFRFAANSILLGLVAALLAGACALILVFANRMHNSRWMRIIIRIATLGYALPGVVLAVGIFIPLAALDGWLRGWIPGPLLTGTLLAMLLGYLIRFLAVAHSPLSSAMQRVAPTIEEAARSLGVSGFSMLRRIHLPSLRGGLLTALILVFVDVLKEMPITLMTRPFGWDTLAVRIFEMTSEGEWERAALPAAAMVLTGFIPILFLTRQASREKVV